MRRFGDPLWLPECPAGWAWDFGGGCVRWEKQAMSTAAALTSGPEAAGAQGLVEKVRVFLTKDGAS